MTKKSFMKGKKGQFDIQSSINVIQHFNRINNGMGYHNRREKKHLIQNFIMIKSFLKQNKLS